MQMAISSLEQELLDQVSQMGAEQQRRVLDFARSLATVERRGVCGKDLLQFAGTIEADDLRLMVEAIQEDCEKVDLNEW
jgi:hypothetical protein